ncbi:MAG: GH39 family glycosyl hydrolase [Planctomycetota bacterium]
MKINVDAATVVAPLKPFWAGQCNPMIETSAAGDRPLVTYMADVGIRYWRTDIWGGPAENWPQQDRTAEAILAAGAKPIVIVGVPGELFPVRKRDHLPRDRNPGPVDMVKWQEHVFEMVSYAVKRFGAKEVSTWYWECMNEPAGPSGIELDIYCRIYDHFATGARRALPTVKVGGPNISTRAWLPFLHSFLTHCAEELNYATGETGTPLDFVAFHSYAGHPGREWPWPQPEVIVAHIQEASKYISLQPGLKDCPLLVDEWGISWGGWLNVDGGVAGYEGGKLGFEGGMGPLPHLVHRDNEYAPAFLCKLVSEICFLTDHYDYIKADVLAWCPAGGRDLVNGRDFDGGRCLVSSYSGFRQPLVNAYDLLNRLGDQRIQLVSSETDRTISGIATRADNGSVQVMLVRFSGDPHEERTETAIDLTIDNLPFEGDVTVEHYRIDHAHSNAHAAWVAQGSPYQPTPEQAAAIRERESLETLEPPTTAPVEGGKFTKTINLPPCSVSLIVLRP